MLRNKLNGIGLRKFNTKSEEVLSFRRRLFKDSLWNGGVTHLNYVGSWLNALNSRVVGSLRSALFRILQQFIYNRASYGKL